MTRTRLRLRTLAGGITTALVLTGPASMVGLAGTAAAHDRTGGWSAPTGWVGSVSIDDIDCDDIAASRDALTTARDEAAATKRAFARASKGSLVKKARAQRSSERREARRALRQARRELGQLRRSYTATGARVLARHGDWDDDRDWDDDDRDWRGDWSGDWDRDWDRDDDRDSSRDDSDDRWDTWGGLDSVDTSGLSEQLKQALAALQAARDALAALSESDRETLRDIIRGLRADREQKRDDWHDAREALEELREAFRECLADGEGDDGSTDGDDVITETPNDPVTPAPLPDDEGTQDPSGDTII